MALTDFAYFDIVYVLLISAVSHCTCISTHGSGLAAAMSQHNWWWHQSFSMLLHLILSLSCLLLTSPSVSLDDRLPHHSCFLLASWSSVRAGSSGHIIGSVALVKGIPSGEQHLYRWGCREPLGFSWWSHCWELTHKVQSRLVPLFSLVHLTRFTKGHCRMWSTTTTTPASAELPKLKRRGMSSITKTRIVMKGRISSREDRELTFIMTVDKW